MSEKLVKFDGVTDLQSYYMPFRAGRFEFRIRQDGEGEVKLSKLDKAKREHRVWGYLSQESIVALWAALDRYVKKHGLESLVETEAEYKARIIQKNKEADQLFDSLVEKRR